MEILQSHSFSLVPGNGAPLGSYLLLILSFVVFLFSLVFLVSTLRRLTARLQVRRGARYRVKTIDLTSDYRNRIELANAGKGITAGVGMAVLVSMLVPAPATAYRFKLADRLLQNPDGIICVLTSRIAVPNFAGFRTVLEVQDGAKVEASSPREKPFRSA